jgi:hypothetical protein
MQELQKDKPLGIIGKLHTKDFHSVDRDSDLRFLVLIIVPS